MKKIVVISDLHCGHRAGLTPPAYQYVETGAGRRSSYAILQKSLWNWFANEAKSLGEIDLLVINGDAIDGKGTKNGGRELITVDRDEQIEMATECIKQFNSKKIIIVEGTPYHTGTDESWEALLAQSLGCALSDTKEKAAEYGAHIWFDADGVIFDCRHKVSSSVIPHGRFTAPQRAGLWNVLWAEKGIQPNAQVIIRSHVHYFTAAYTSQKLVITTPALQTHSNYGSRECDGTNDIGFISFIVEDGIPKMKTHLYEVKNTLRAKVVKL